MLDSYYQELVPVELPFANRQMYMHTFDLAAPVMPLGYEDYLKPVKELCKAARAFKGLAHMTVDEKVILAGNTQRKPKPHVDGCYIPRMSSWGHDGGSGWNHYCNNIRAEKIGRMSVIVAASVAGCRVWRGLFKGQPKSDGDLSHIAEPLGKGEVLPSSVGYRLSPDCVHESMPFDTDTQRTFLRIALPVS